MFWREWTFLEEVHCRTEAGPLDVVEGEVTEKQVCDNSCYRHLQDAETIEFNWLFLCCTIINIDTKEILCEDTD
jgi:hypothetical protein